METVRFRVDRLQHEAGGIQDMQTAPLRPAGRHRVSVARAVFVAAEVDTAGSLLADVDLLPLFEHKLDRITTLGMGKEGNLIRVRADGHFSFLPYSVELLLRAHPGGGYDSVLLNGNALVGFSGSFGVRHVEGGCVVTHVEQYEFRGGWVGQALGRLWRPYIAGSMVQEVRRLKRLIEEPDLLAAARRTTTVEIRTDRRTPVWDPARSWRSPALSALQRRASWGRP